MAVSVGTFVCLSGSGFSVGTLAGPSGPSQGVQGRLGRLIGCRAVWAVSGGAGPSGRLRGCRVVWAVSVGAGSSRPSQGVQGRLGRLRGCRVVSSIYAKSMHNSENLIFICTRPGLAQAHTVLFVS